MVDYGPLNSEAVGFGGSGNGTLRISLKGEAMSKSKEDLIRTLEIMGPAEFEELYKREISRMQGREKRAALESLEATIRVWV